MTTSVYDSAINTLKAGGTVRINASSSAIMKNGQIWVYNPSQASPQSQVGFDQARRNSSISPITNQQLAAALGTTVTSSPVPKAVAPKVSTTTSVATTTSPLNSALATLNAGGTVVINSNMYVTKAQNQIIYYNPQVINGAGLKGSGAVNQFNAARNNGSINVITQAELGTFVTSTSAPATSPKTTPARTSAATTTARSTSTAKPRTAPKTTSAPTTTAQTSSDKTAIQKLDIDEPLVTPLTPQQISEQLTIELPPLTPENIEEVRTIAASQDATAFEARKDWRVRLALSPDANYLYKADDPKSILGPLAKTDGVIFPYTPTISINYSAQYEQTNIVHSNYKVYNYNSSSVDNISIACDFTCQDVYEANYLLAVIHFFRTMTKMFYGQDQDPKRGTPPPLCYMFGMGSFQFAAHPLAITGFSYNLPNNVDYIKTVGESLSGVEQPSPPAGSSTSSDRLRGTGADVGGTASRENVPTSSNSEGLVTYVPTQIQLQISCLPIMSRNLVSNKFSLKEYATGALLNGVAAGRAGGGFW